MIIGADEFMLVAFAGCLTKEVPAVSCARLNKEGNWAFLLHLTNQA